MPHCTKLYSYSLLQWIYLTQESNQSLLYCRWILYQLSYQREINFGYNYHFYPCTELIHLVQSFIKFRGNNFLTLLNISKSCFYLEFLLSKGYKSGWAGPIFFFFNSCFIAFSSAPSTDRKEMPVVHNGVLHPGLQPSSLISKHTLGFQETTSSGFAAKILFEAD